MSRESILSEEIKSQFICRDCRTNTFHEYYMVNNDLWDTAVRGLKRMMLCVSCLEKRLGRKLVPTDFTECHLNRYPDKSATKKLLNRFGI